MQDKKVREAVSGELYDWPWKFQLITDVFDGEITFFLYGYVREQVSLFRDGDRRVLLKAYVNVSDLNQALSDLLSFRSGVNPFEE